ncbi:probable receptor-like protein kinase At5g20050 [Camellia sinensis]|uniref:probable receptor-like protein kinase At5g20050 n=1 Tax=Camellia sinensis TaxID=4442 RepID=UPI0010362AA5|nr:probable receptor-like protein kinase At5g20050 [Camellia sinensis]
MDAIEKVAVFLVPIPLASTFASERVTSSGILNKGESEELDEFYIDQLPGMLTRFSYEELRVMTTNFDNKLGEGGWFEYMSNGSLDTWIFQRHQELTLGWQPPKKIIMDIAKGLTYLHEECRQKIFHLDIKPQNILLDVCFNAKISDFGLSKLIDKDQSQVVTMMRGTLGYLALNYH